MLFPVEAAPVVSLPVPGRLVISAREALLAWLNRLSGTRLVRLSGDPPFCLS